MSSVGSVLALVSIVSFVIVMKVVICSCLLRLRRRSEEDRIPILEESLVDRLNEIHQTRRRARRAREPPPTFEDALVNSRPVSYIDIEEPPPTYDEYLNANSPNKIGYLDYSPSINPTDILIPMSVSSISINIDTSSSNSGSRDSGLELELESNA